MGTPKGLLGTIQSIWVRGNPLISIFETIPPQNHVFRAPFWGPGTFPGQPGPAWPPNKSWIMEDHEGTLARGRVDRGILSNCNLTLALTETALTEHYHLWAGGLE